MIGRRIGHYQILSALGTGAMGEVYRARDEKLERDVAVKVLPAGLLADEPARSRFRKEAKALSRLSHPHIAMLLDSDSSDGVDFIAMELVPGKTLAERLREGPLPAKEVTRLGAQLARGLKAAHGHGVIHRDLKPSNLALTEDGLLKVLDFGLARLVAQETEGREDDTGTNTAAGKALGSPPYMSPEQVLGKDVDARTDLYSAGALLFELATGRRPFGDLRGGELADAILHKIPDRPSAVLATVPASLEALILKALEKDPALRHQTAGDLLADLERLARDEQPMALGSAGRMGDAAAGAARWRKSRRSILVALALIALLSAVWFLRPPPPPRVVGIRPIIELDKVPDGYATSDGERLYYSIGNSVGFRHYLVPLSGGESHEIPFPYRLGYVLGYVRSQSALLMTGAMELAEEWPLYLVSVPSWEVRRLGDLKAYLASVSPDEQQIALLYGPGQRKIGIARIDGSGFRQVLELPHWAWHLEWAPDGRRLRFAGPAPGGREGAAWTWEASVAGGPARALWPGVGGVRAGDGRHYIVPREEKSFDRGRSDLFAIDDETWFPWRRHAVRVTSGPMSFWGLGSPNGRDVYAVGDLPHGELVRIDPRSGRPHPYAGGVSAGYADVSPDGGWVAWVTHPRRELWKSRPDGSERTQLTAPGTTVFLARWSPDGRSLAFVGRMPGEQPTFVARIGADGGAAEVLVRSKPDEQFWDCCWLPGGERILFSRMYPLQPGVFEIDVRSRQVSLLAGGERLFYPKCSRHGHVLASRLEDNMVAQYRVRWWGRQDWEDIDLGSLSYPSWTRDGKAIISLDPERRRIERFSLDARRRETLTELGAMPLVIWASVPWMGLAADDSPLVTLDRGRHGFYALEWEGR